VVLVLFLIPFLIVFRISFSEVRLAIPPYTPLFTWHHGSPSLQLHWSSYAFLFTDSLYVSSYVYSLKVAAGLDLVLSFDRLPDGLRHRGVPLLRRARCC